MSVLLTTANSNRLTRTASVLDQTADFTIAGWFYLTTASTLWTSFWIGADGSTASEAWGTVISTGGDPIRLKMQSRNSSEAGTSSLESSVGNTVDDAAWYYIAMQRNSTNFKILVRPSGGSCSEWISVAAASPQTAGARMNIGARIASSNLFPGRVAYCRAWTSVLTTTQLDTEAVAPSAVITTNLWGDWPLTVHTDLTDDSGNGRDWTGVGTLSTADDPPDVVFGPTITGQPTAQTARVNGDTTNTATFSVTATGTGGLTYDWELETSVGGGSYSNLADGNGATWTGQTSASCVGTFTAKTLSGRRVRCNVTDSNGTTTTDAVVLTVLDGPVLSAASATTNGSGVASVTMTSDDALTANGEILLVTASIRGEVIARTTVRPA